MELFPLCLKKKYYSITAKSNCILNLREYKKPWEKFKKKHPNSLLEDFFFSCNIPGVIQGLQFPLSFFFWKMQFWNAAFYPVKAALLYLNPSVPPAVSHRAICLLPRIRGTSTALLFVIAFLCYIWSLKTVEQWSITYFMFRKFTWKHQIF